MMILFSSNKIIISLIIYVYFRTPTAKMVFTSVTTTVLPKQSNMTVNIKATETTKLLVCDSAFGCYDNK